MSEMTPSASVATRSRFRFGWPWWVAIAAAVVVMVGGAVVVATALNVNANRPRVAVAAYLEALKDGEAAKALALDGVKTSDSDVLLTDKAYGNATKRITAFHLRPAVVGGDHASVTASITQGSHTYSQVFTLTRAGRSFLVFDDWKLQPVALTKVAIAFDGPEAVPFTIVGQTFASTADVELRALPGTYNVLIGADASYMLYTRPFTVTAVGFGSATPAPAKVEIELSAKGYDTATAAVKKFLDGCAASTALAPPGCPFRTYSSAGVTVDTAHWTIDTRPEVEIGPYTNGGWPVVSTKLGAAKLSGTAHDTAGRSGEVSTSDIPFGLVGTVTFSGETATYSQLIK